MQRIVARLGVFLLAMISFSITLIYGGAAWAPPIEGIPDTGQATSCALQFAIFAHVVFGLRVFGLQLEDLTIVACVIRAKPFWGYSEFRV